MPDAILGISAYYHDSAAALLVDGILVAAAQEERFTRKKHDASFPAHAVQFVLKEAGIGPADVSAVVFYEKPLLKFERLLETYHAFAPRGFTGFLHAIPIWIKDKLFMKKMLREELARFGLEKHRIYFPEHHLSHAASAFYPSPFGEAAILTVDGVGEWATTTICRGSGNRIEILRQLDFPHSIGLLYSAFTYYCGFKVNSGEYKLMGLAPYGNHRSDQCTRFADKIRTELVDIREDGSILLNMKYFRFATGMKMTNDALWEELFGIPPRKEESDLTVDYMNLALAIQTVTEEIILKLARTARELSGCRNLAMAGGVALNSVANGRLLASGLFDELWIQPAAGDAGGAVGAAFAAWYTLFDHPRAGESGQDAMQGAFLGPEYDDKEIAKVLRKYSAVKRYFTDFDDLAAHAAQLVAEGNVVGWFQGRMEFGPRALGNRSIVGDPRNPEMQKMMNLRIKFREGFRPFAPAVLQEDIREYFALDRPSPYMLLVVPVVQGRCRHLPDGYQEMEWHDRLYFPRSDVPAVTHIDYSARLQSVGRETNPRFWKLIAEFRTLTGCSVVINTSFNVRGEPIVCSPDDAYKCFMRTEMNYLVMGNYLLSKVEQPELPASILKMEAFIPD